MIAAFIWRLPVETVTSLGVTVVRRQMTERQSSAVASDPSAYGRVVGGNGGASSVKMS
jgi:hypothetical protein